MILQISGFDKTLEDEHINEYIHANVNHSLRDNQAEEYLSFGNRSVHSEGKCF